MHDCTLLTRDGCGLCLRVGEVGLHSGGVTYFPRKSAEYIVLKRSCFSGPLPPEITFLDDVCFLRMFCAEVVRCLNSFCITFSSSCRWSDWFSGNGESLATADFTLRRLGLVSCLGPSVSVGSRSAMFWLLGRQWAWLYFDVAAYLPLIGENVLISPYKQHLV